TRLFLAVARFQMRLIQQVGKKSYHRMLAYDKQSFIDLVRSYAEWIPLNQVLRLFQMNPRLFKSWVSQVSFSCESSSLSLCAKQHPFQITHQEYKVIESSLNDPVYAYWPKSAIHSDLLKKNLLTVSRSTYYKHAKLIQPESQKRDYKKPTYTPLRAERVNEIWHMDISQFRTRDDRRYYIYAIIDNYSRKILVWSCLDCISQIEIGNLISKALENLSGIRIRLISDAGTENVNKYIQKLLHEFFNEYDKHINHQIALRHIRQSNSMIERFFRIMKSQYLYRENPANYPDLYQRLEFTFNEYNGLRPHYSLQHQTPNEAYAGALARDFREQYSRAQNQRFKKNKNCPCRVCTCTLEANARHAFAGT
ncbi:MAG TPA: hypothetical protein DIW47_05005, partial [Bacteroidetes bacterium]|nr:hypothetical protein [Bacteroidota bacterium]